MLDSCEEVVEITMLDRELKGVAMLDNCEEVVEKTMLDRELLEGAAKLDS